MRIAQASNRVDAGGDLEANGTGIHRGVIEPCYLLQEGYADTYQELLNEVDWSNYGHASENPKCANCMVHSGYEATAVDQTFSGFGGIWANVKAILFSTYANPTAAKSGPTTMSDSRMNARLAAMIE